MKKKVLINGRFTTHHFAIRNVIFNITKELSRYDDIDLIVLVNRDSQLDDFEQINVKLLKVPIPSDSAILNHLVTIFIVPFILFFKRIKVVIYPQISIYLFNPCKVILYMHDLIEYIIDNQTKSRLVFRKLSYPYNCRHADRIITVSDNTKKDLIKYLNIPAEKIKIAYNGYSDIIYMENKDDASEYVFKKYGIKNYLFYIGYLTHPQKNLIYLINEFKKVLNTYPDSQLTFAGPLGKDSVLILKHAAEILGDRKFKYLGKVPAEDLRYLYSACEAFCFPSLYEGFGMPVLEAMACGAPVITSNISSMPEILNDDRFLINPYCPDDLYNKALCILSENRDKITSRNVERAKSFSWTNHGKILYETIKEISSKVILNIK